MGFLRPLSPDDQGRRRFQVLSPVDQTDTGSFTCASPADVDAAMARARAVQPAWAQTPIKDRAALMQNALKLLIERQEDYLKILISDTGRTEMETRFMEILATCDVMNFYGRRAHKILKDDRPGLHLLRTKRASIAYRPMGVVAVISPWNGPFILSINPTIQAVLAGNAVLIKPSEVTPWSASLVQTLFEDAGFPKGLVQVLLGDGDTGKALIDALPDKVSFTGSVDTGRTVGRSCGEKLIPCTLELGGKDAMIICADAPMERAIGGAVFGSLMNAGQYCSGTERIYVVREVAETFIQGVVEKVAAIQLGRDIGPFIFEPQLDLVEKQVNDAVAAGARVLTGGQRAGSFFQPTVLVDVTHQMDVMTEETFGPILPILIVEDEEEAIRMANDCRFGLGAAIWTQDKAKGERMGRRLNAGSVIINDAAVAYGALEVPFGGRKESGVGSVNGANGLRNFCHAQPILTERLGPKEERVWYPFTPEKVDGIKQAVAWIWGTPIRWLM